MDAFDSLFYYISYVEMRLIISSMSVSVMYQTETMLLQTFANRLECLDIPAIETPAIHLNLAEPDTDEFKQHNAFFKDLNNQLKFNSLMKTPEYAECKDRINRITTAYDKAYVACEFKKRDVVGKIIDYRIEHNDHMPEPVRLTYENGNKRYVSIYQFLRMNLPMKDDIYEQFANIARGNNISTEKFIEECRKRKHKYAPNERFSDYYGSGALNTEFAGV
jgi:hypothetical protein